MQSNSFDPLEPSVPRRADLLTVAVFLLIVGVPPLMLFRSGVDELVRETERRQAAALPTLAFREGRLFPRTQSLEQFPRKFEAWFNDHLGFRRSWISLFNLAKMSGLTSSDVAQLSVGNSTGSSVLVGRDGWLFYTGEHIIDDYRCTDPLTVAELDRWRRVLQERQRWLADRGIHYVVFVAPNKHTIYDEYLPRAVNRVGTQSRLDQLIETLDSSGVEFVDIRPGLLEGKATHRTYHKTDTHWNDFGAYLGYRQVMNTVARWLPQAAPHPLAGFDISIVETEGDYLATLLYSPTAFREERVKLTPKSPRTAQFDVIDAAEGLPGSIVSINPQAPLGTAVFLGDSFGVAFAHYFSEHFRRVHYVGDYEFVPELIEREQPVLVVQEYVERRLMRHQPKNPSSMQTTIERFARQTEPARVH